MKISVASYEKYILCTCIVLSYLHLMFSKSLLSIKLNTALIVFNTFTNEILQINVAIKICWILKDKQINIRIH